MALLSEVEAHTFYQFLRMVSVTKCRALNIYGWGDADPLFYLPGSLPTFSSLTSLVLDNLDLRDLWAPAISSALDTAIITRLDLIECGQYHIMEGQFPRLEKFSVSIGCTLPKLFKFLDMHPTIRSLRVEGTPTCLRATTLPGICLPKLKRLRATAYVANRVMRRHFDPIKPFHLDLLSVRPDVSSDPLLSWLHRDSWLSQFNEQVSGSLGYCQAVRNLRLTLPASIYNCGCGPKVTHLASPAVRCLIIRNNDHSEAALAVRVHSGHRRC